jgi:RNA-splicing ligase RtcB
MRKMSRGRPEVIPEDLGTEENMLTGNSKLLSGRSPGLSGANRKASRS